LAGRRQAAAAGLITAKLVDDGAVRYRDDGRIHEVMPVVEAFLRKVPMSPQVTGKLAARCRGVWRKVSEILQVGAGNVAGIGGLPRKPAVSVICLAVYARHGIRGKTPGGAGMPFLDPREEVFNGVPGRRFTPGLEGGLVALFPIGAFRTEDEIVEGVGSPSAAGDRKSTRLNSSHVKISYAVFCLKKKND